MQTHLREVTPIPGKNQDYGEVNQRCVFPSDRQRGARGGCFLTAMSREACSSPALSHRGGPVTLIPSDTENPCSRPHGISQRILELGFVCVGVTPCKILGVL